MTSPRDTVLYRRLFQQARPYWTHIAALFFLSMLASPLALLLPLPLKIAVDSLYRVQTDAASIQAITVDYLVPFLKSSLTLAGMFYVTARIDWQLALVALFISPILYMVSKVYRRGLRRGSREAKTYDSATL